MEFILAYFEQYLSLSPESKGKISDCVVKLFLPKGTILVEQGETNLFMYVIEKGIARGFRTQGNEEVTISLWKENESFGDVTTYITQQPAVKLYQLLQDSVLYRIDVIKFRGFFSVNHEICNLGRIIVEKYVLFMERSIKQYRGMTAQEKYDFFLQDRPDLIFRIKFIYIASFLNMAPETLSRIHSKWLKSH